MYNSKFEGMDRVELEAFQLEKLRETLINVYENVPLYKQLFDEKNVTPQDLHSLEDLKKFPFFYKQYFRDQYPYGLLAVELENVKRLHASSGTTGKPTIVAYTQTDLDSWSELIARSMASIGVTNKDIVQVCFGYGLFTGGLGIHYGLEKLGATVIPASTGNTQKQITLMQDLGTTVIAATPSYALHLYEEIVKLGIDPKSLNLKVGVFGAEAWTEELRTEIEEKFNIKAYDIFGLSEATGPGVAVECEEKNGLHLFEDYFLPEIIDPDTGQVLPAGEYGELVLTSIQKEAIPIIRYRTGDIAALNYEACACGRTHVRMSKPRGRSDDMLVIRGVNIFPSQVESTILSTGIGTSHFLLVIKRENNLDSLEIQVELPLEDQTEDKINKLKKTLVSVLGLGFKLTVLNDQTLARSEGKSKKILDLRSK